ncbi:MAG: ATPase, T2SS/T4P/T4SS family [Rhodothermales bacterium]
MNPYSAGDDAAASAALATVEPASVRLRKHRPDAEPPVTPYAPEACQEVLNRVPKSLRGMDLLKGVAKALRSLDEGPRASITLHLEALVRHMTHIDASDLDMGGDSCRGNVWYRIHGDKKPHGKLGNYSPAECNVFFLNMLSEVQTMNLLKNYAVDFSYQLQAGKDNGEWHRFRMTIYFDNDNLALNVRSITNELRDLESLGFHPTIQKGLLFEHVRDGLTLVTGVTGSGKSTTLDAIVDANNRRTPGHIVIIGEPIEFMHASKRCIVRHREVGKDVGSFSDGVVQSLRQDPDIIVIGEMRDPKTISAAIEVTDSGHKVFSTLHTSSAIESVARIVGEYATEEQERIRYRLADVLRCIISQKLLPTTSGGRIMAKEVLWVTPSVRAAIKSNNVNEIYQMMWEGRAQGQVTLEQDLAMLLKAGKISSETAMNYANNKKRLQQILGMA